MNMQTMKTLMVLVVLANGDVDLCIYEYKRNGKVNRVGHRFTVAPWADILAMITPQPDCRVVVYSHCRWFRNCERHATGATEHPVLGHIGTCDRCHKFATGEDRATGA